MRREFWWISIVILSLIGFAGWINPFFFWIYLVVLPVFFAGVYDFFQVKHTVRRNFPIAGRFRYWLEMIRPEVNQYFIESNSDGAPFSREQRSLVYQRAKKVIDTLPFGTQINLYSQGYEWVNHSVQTSHVEPRSLRVKIGSDQCKQPYDASLFNISAMSFGALSKNAVEALNGGAALGGFAHNTGEGGVSDYHLHRGGDLIWQIGTGYFGCRSDDGSFDPKKYATQVRRPEIKMIEIKLSQGAKPGHGGILPAQKITPEIARIRSVKMGEDVVSPPSHSAFKTPLELMEFVKTLRDLSDGKPIGIKLCIGKRREFIAICKAMVESGICPDYVAVDGGEGGTGAAPLEFSNHVGSPGVESLAFVHNCLVGFNLREQVKVMATGKVISGFGIIKRLCLGADAIYSARGFMMALGCIQALRCNNNACPTGVATQDPQLVAGLVVSDKIQRVKAFHEETIESVADILGAMGLESPDELRPWHLMRRVGDVDLRHYGELIHFIGPGELLDPARVPHTFRRAWQAATPESFRHVGH